ncbi:Mrp/NBP35 family ATP-binding protein [Halothermothrix orenii]|uniref:Iron-sulfur cluster carrier protein n=1 Tax=Halothermothrix orenii (strain H 168 / OCM 544 / DSM 9562) TaxID=373903 RepID=B8CZ62_HALOH|nr:Mrp/NBP35 family ATP-binding protein [Halothermothrix orenii]ACL70581.1 ATP-binding protein involved in chromosome partitioning [Halothermothrix orenii H 168]
MYQVKDNKLVLNHGSIEKGLIAVASGKGGVGKSTVTSNLALSLKEKGNRVGIVDADIHGFSIPRILGLKEEPRALNDKEIIPPEVKGIKVMSMGSFVGENEAVIWRAPLLAGALQQFMEDVHWGELDYLLLDLPPGTGDMALNIMQKLPHSELLIVTTPQVVATKVAGRIARVAEKLNINIAGVVENMSYYKCPDCGHKEYIFGEGGGKELASFLKTDLLGQIPLEPEIRKLGDEGQPLILNNPGSEVTRVYNSIADKIENNRGEFDPDVKPLFLQGSPGGKKKV